MNQSIMEAYAEVDTILNYMDIKYKNEIPEKLRNIFKEKKADNYEKTIIPNKPLNEQNLKEETLSILAVLNYNYWCKDEIHKKELLKLYTENERKYQEELREKYNSDNIFRSRIQEKDENVINNEVSMIEYKESIFKKIMNKIKGIFNR